MGAAEEYPFWGWRNLANLALAPVVMLPSVLATGWWLYDPPWVELHPVWVLNLLFFANVTVGFWLISLVLRNGWLIDLYWTLLPPLMAAFYAFHPAANPDSTRATASWILLGVWSARLTHNYLRREGWRFGRREDWRFAKWRREQRHFWFTSFFTAYLSQHLALVGITLPLWAIHHSPQPWGGVDLLFSLSALGGIGIAARADNELRRFVKANAQRKARGEDPVSLLDTGIWGWSRHPNYVGEQLFWWSFGGLGWSTGYSWVLIGAAFNSLLLAGVTVMVEREMLADPELGSLYRGYRQRVSAWIPLRRPRPAA